MTEYNIPAWEDTYFTTGASPYEYYIVADGTDVFHGKVWKSPNEAETKVNVTKIIRDWLANQLPDFRNIADVVEKHERAYRTFDLCEVGGDVVARYNVLFDYDGEWNGEYKVLTEPIDGHLDPRMKFLWSIYSPTDIDIYMSPYYFRLLNNPVTVGSFSGDTAIILWDTNNMRAVITCTPDNWLEVTDISLTGATLHVKVDNDTMSANTGNIDIYIDGEYETSLTVVQEGKYFNLIDSEVGLSHAGGTDNIRWQTNINSAALTVNSDYTGFTCSNITSSGCSISASPIPEDEYRTGNISIYSGNTLLGVVAVTQGDFENMYLTARIYSGGSMECMWYVSNLYTGDTPEIYHRIRRNGVLGEWVRDPSWNDGYSTHISVQAGDEVEFKGIQAVAELEERWGYTCPVGELYGNILSTEWGDDFRGKTTGNGRVTTSYFEVYGSIWKAIKWIISAEHLVIPLTVAPHMEGMFFNCTNLKKGPKLPSTILSGETCYRGMFEGCTSLIKAPDLPATVLTVKCYEEMFRGCTSLVNPPVISATTVARCCCQYMFSNCTSLARAPYLPATDLSDGILCYQEMFEGCTSLTESPDLPATILSGSCYGGMFAACTSLTKAPGLPATAATQSCYSGMFRGCTSLVNPPVISATTVEENCYRFMFEDCTSLATAPALPATTLKEWCYANMFECCTSLTEAPDLPATVLDEYCYWSMFSGCTSLTTVSDLPATRLYEGSYENMFRGCTSLAEAPDLPATELAERCYDYMFYGCTSLLKAPDLPATRIYSTSYKKMFQGCTALIVPPEMAVLTGATSGCTEMFAGCTSLTKSPVLRETQLSNADRHCYTGMFSGCTRLNEVTCLFDNVSGGYDYHKNWLAGVATYGTFKRNPNHTYNWPSGPDGIPTNWTIVDYTP